LKWLDKVLELEILTISMKRKKILSPKMRSKNLTVTVAKRRLLTPQSPERRS
jgi:hypothetical protein